MDQIRLCVDCVHHKKDEGLGRHYCERVVEIDPVDGSRKKSYRRCSDEREPFGSCRPEGIHWVKRQGDDKPGKRGFLRGILDWFTDASRAPFKSDVGF